MLRYRRSQTAGATYFFTVVSYRRQGILCETRIRKALRDAIAKVRGKRPFEIDAWVLLPDAFTLRMDPAAGRCGLRDPLGNDKAAGECAMWRVV